MTTPIQKKTKAEVVEEYNRLLAKLEEAKELAKRADNPKNLELQETVKDFSTDEIAQQINNLKFLVNNNLDNLIQKLLSAYQTFSKIQEGIRASQEYLASAHNIQVSAQALNQLISDYDSKESELEAEFRKRRLELDYEDQMQRLKSQRQIEEEGYMAQTKLKREKEVVEEELAKQKKLMEDREVILASKEEELQSLKAQVASFEQRVERIVNQSRVEVIKQMEDDFQKRLASVNLERNNEANISNLNIKHLESTTKSQSQEIEKLRKELERAYAQLQATAIKLIEAGGGRGNNQVTSGHFNNHQQTPLQSPMPIHTID